MATQTGSIDLSTTGSFKTYASGEYATLDYVNPTETVSGTIVSASDALAAPPRDLTIYGTSTQNGTPTPDAPVAIESVDSISLLTRGRNLLGNFGSATVRNVTGTVNSDGSITFSGTPSGGTLYYTIDGRGPNGSGRRGIEYAADGCLKPGATYTVSGTNVYVYLYDASSKMLGSYKNATFTVPAETRYAWMAVSVANGSSALDGVTVYPQLELGSTATEYEQYQGTSTSIDLQGHQLRSLPDGTRDELSVDSAGNVTLTQRVGVTTQATTDGISATVGTDAMSTTGDLSDGATVIYRLGSPQTVSLGTVEPPALPSPDVTAWCVDTTPISMEVWKASANPEYYRVSSEVTQTAVDVSTLFEETGELSTLIRDYSGGTLVAKVGQDRGALVNADGSFDVVALTWSGETPTVGATLATMGGTTARIGASTAPHVDVSSSGMEVFTDASTRALRAFVDSNGYGSVSLGSDSSVSIGGDAGQLYLIATDNSDISTITVQSNSSPGYVGIDFESGEGAWDMQLKAYNGSVRPTIDLGITSSQTAGSFEVSNVGSYSFSNPEKVVEAIGAVRDASGLNARVAQLTGSGQMWCLRANVDNSGSTHDEHDVGLYTTDDGRLVLYDFTAGSAIWTVDGLATEDSPTLSGATATTFTVRRARPTCTLYVYGLKVSSQLASGSTLSLGTLSSGFRPAYRTSVMLASTTNNASRGVWLDVNSTGAVTLQNRSGNALSTSATLSGALTWVL